MREGDASVEASFDGASEAVGRVAQDAWPLFFCELYRLLRDLDQATCSHDPGIPNHLLDIVPFES